MPPVYDTKDICIYSGDGGLPFDTILVLVGHDLDIKKPGHFREHKNPLVRNIQKMCFVI